MKLSIYIKFVIIYVVAAVLSFVFVAEGTSRMITNHVTTEKADNLYREALLLSTEYAEDYYHSRSATSLETVYSHLNAIATYINADIWMIDIDGKVILETEKKLVSPENNAHILKNFDPTTFGTSYYMTGDFFEQFDEEMLSVISPINYGYKVHGYLVIHTETSELMAE